jgi:hypothetical protein
MQKLWTVAAMIAGYLFDERLYSGNWDAAVTD